MRQIFIVLAIAIIPCSALAGPTCTSEPKEKWMSENAMKVKIGELGYQYKIFKVTTGNCYEIYGQDKQGKRIEIYFNPITGDVVEEHKS